MQKENKRILMTRQLLQDALLKLLKNQPIHTISIRELCSKAGINRTTFYNHYGSQFDLLQDISQRFLDCVSLRLQNSQNNLPEEIQVQVTMVLTYMEDNLELTKVLLNNTADPAFAERLFTLPQITTLLDCALAECTDAEEKKAIITFAIHGAYRLLCDWINTPDRISAEAQTTLILRLARRVCRSDSL